MKLCEHLAPLFHQEIKNGNSIVFLHNQGRFDISEDNLIVYMQKALGDYGESDKIKLITLLDWKYSNITPSNINNVGVYRQYECSECHCAVCGPTETTIHNWVKRDPFYTPIDTRASANLDGISIEDDLWKEMHNRKHFKSCIVPSISGFKDGYKQPVEDFPKKLCGHIKKLYQNEIQKGNKVGFLSRRGEYLIVYFVRCPAKYSDLGTLVFTIEKDPHFPNSYQYSCPDCKCSLFFPLENDQYGWLSEKKWLPIVEDAVATPETIEISSGLWNNMWRSDLYALVPKIIMS